MSNNAGIAPDIRRRIDDALDGPGPCARCNKNHPLKDCPMIPHNGQKGRIWKDLPPDVQGLASSYLLNHKKYKGPVSRSSTAANTTSRTVRPSTGQASRQSVAKQPVTSYLNNDTLSGMYYPQAAPLPSHNSLSGGTPWVLPESMKLCGTAGKIPEPLFPIRESFFKDRPGIPTILTNHFEYKLEAKEFYEYKIILGLDIKNRRRRKELFEAAMIHWPFLKQNQNHFATNSLDTIVSWKPLHLALDKGTEEWEQKIPVPNKVALDAKFRLLPPREASTLRQYASANPSCEGKNYEAQIGDITRCLNIVISKGFGNDIHKVSLNKFFVKTARSLLLKSDHNTASNQLELIRGYYYNVKPGMGNIILNFNICTSAVFRPITIAEFLNQDNTFDSVEKLRALLKGKTVYLTLERDDKDPKKKRFLNEEKARYWTVFEIQADGNIEDLSFQTGEGSNVKTVKVIDHLQTVSASNARPTIGRPAVNVGTGRHKIWYAQEHLRLVPFQSYNRPVPPDYAASMVEQACRSPKESRALIEKEGLPSMGFTVGAVAKNFGSDVPVTLVPMMLQVPYQALRMPVAHYSRWNRNEAKIDDISAKPQSHWKLPKGAHFFQVNPKRSIRYAILADTGITRDVASKVETQLNYQFEKLNVRHNGCLRVDIAQIDLKHKDKVIQKLQDLKSRDVDVVFFLLTALNKIAYQSIKNATDRSLAMQSVCIIKNRVDSVDKYINIMMKVNLKLGGVNHRVDGANAWLKTTMIIGADLIHPGPGSFLGTPSIAAIVGSVDPNGGKCLGSLRLQNNMKNDREIIDQDSLEDMVQDRLTSWRELHKSLPNNIVYFRDGVSSSHYQKVYDQELKAIEAAYESARKKSKDLPLKLTAVVVTKRHHTRFYPRFDKDGDEWGNLNTKPGTCVDQLVTSPYYQDFFLQSHSGIKGTARPTHYFVLKNNIPGMTLKTLRDLTYQLCYSYVRSTSGVSYVSPTYYADRLCERGRLYIHKFYSGEDADFERELKLAKDKMALAQANARKAKFPPRPSRQKTTDERKAEKDDAEDLIKHMKKITWDAVFNEFYNQPRRPDPADPGKVWMNPYAYGLRNTMFWM